MAGIEGRAREQVLLRSFLAVCGALPWVGLIAFLVWAVLNIVVGWLLRDVWSGTELVTFDDLTKVDDAFRLGLVGTRDAVWARGSAAVSSRLDNVRPALLSLAAIWAGLTALAQTYTAIAVARRAGDALPHRSNLLHTIRRAPRVLVGWAVVVIAVGGILGLADRITRGHPWYLSVSAAVVANVVAWFLFARMCFVVAIAVADDGLVPGLGWAQCLIRSWSEVRGRTGRVLWRVGLLCVVPIAIVAAPLQGLALGEGATGFAIGLAIASQLAAITVGMAAITGGATALYVTDYRHD